MSSSINPNSINGNYPIAGQDNDSQGFRDNFTNVKNNLTFTKAEMEDLQNNVLLKTALSGTTLNNNLNNSQLISVQRLKFTDTIFDNVASGAILWTNAHYQILTPTASTALTFGGWPTSGFYTSFKLKVVINNIGWTITLPASVTINTSNIQGTVGQVITFLTTGIYEFEFGTYDGGTTVSIRDMLNNYDTVTGIFSVTGVTTLTGNVNASTNLNVTGVTTLTGNVTTSGNLIASGGHIITGHQYSIATTGFNDVTGGNVSRVIYNPAGTLANGTLTLPLGNVEAKIVTVSSTQTITAFQVLPNAGTTLTPSANITLAAGTSVAYFYKASIPGWLKIS